MLKAACAEAADLSDAVAAGGVLGRELGRRLGGPPKAVLLFAPFHGVDPVALVRGLAEACPGAAVAGGSTYGGILGAELKEESAVALGLAGDLSAATGVGTGLVKDSFGAGAQAARRALAGLGSVEPKVLFLFHEPQMGDPAKVHEGARSVLGPNFPIVGGGTGTGFLMEQSPVSVQFEGARALAGCAAGMLLGGPFRLSCGFSHGGVPIGEPHLLTKVRGNILVEFDGRPALDVMAEEMGRDSTAADLSFASNFALGAVWPDTEEFTLRGIWGVDAKEKTLLCGTPVEEGVRYRLVQVTPESILEQTKAAAREAAAVLGKGGVKAAVCIDCYGRKIQLGAHGLVGEELRIISGALGGAPMAGMFAGSEIGVLDARTPRRRARYGHASTSFALLGDA